MHFLQAINSDISVLYSLYNKTGGTIKGDIRKKDMVLPSLPFVNVTVCSESHSDTKIPLKPLLGVFAKLRKMILVSSCPSVP